MARERIVFCWSGGKDSALALNRVLQDDRYEVVTLLTTCNEHFQRVSMHGIRVELMDRQAAAIGLPLQKVFVSERGSNEEYQQRMSECLLAWKANGVTACAFGDIFLEDLRLWREQNLEAIGFRGVFPIWKVDSRQLIREFFDLGFASVICCVNDAYLGEASVGRLIDAGFIETLPPEVDVCGENGEFHSFAFDGPVFTSPVQFTIGEKVYRPLESSVSMDDDNDRSGSAVSRPTKGFWFCDLLPIDN